MAARPTLRDPKEYALVKRIYGFDGPTPSDDIGPDERADRMQHGTKQNHSR